MASFRVQYVDPGVSVIRGFHNSTAIETSYPWGKKMVVRVPRWPIYFRPLKSGPHVTPFITISERVPSKLKKVTAQWMAFGGGALVFAVAGWEWGVYVVIHGGSENATGWNRVPLSHANCILNWM